MYSGQKNWKHYGAYTFETPLSQEEAFRREVIVKSTKSKPVEAVRVLYYNAGTLQDWHPGAGYPSYFFTDEVRLIRE